MAAHSSTLAALLSAVLPGLGQLYHREWRKGAAFLTATVALDSALGVTARTADVLHAAMHGSGVENLASLTIRSLPLLALALWSVVDARRPRSMPGTMPAPPLR